ncbi:MAG: HEAT repeat domain-containing protein [Chloroflexi bacterium]|nr:HEAT repeat domain-containing protein [Chloroflexota bacterium]
MENNADISLEELLAALLDDSNPLSARYLYRFSDLNPEEIAALRNDWGDITIERRQRLMEDLEELEDTNTIVSFEHVFRLAMEDEDPLVRKFAIRSLWNYENPILIPVFIDLMEHDNSDQVRAQAASALGRFIYLGELEEIPEQMANSIVDKLLTIMAGEAEESLRLRALESLGFSCRESIQDLINEAIELGDENWVASALVAIGRSSDDDWAPSVLDKLDDDRAMVRIEAIRAAGELGLQAATPAMLYLLESEDDEIRLAAAWALSEIGGEGIRDGLEMLLVESGDETEEEVIEEALENLTLTEEIATFNLLDISEEDLEEFEGFRGPPSREDSKD